MYINMVCRLFASIPFVNIMAIRSWNQNSMKKEVPGKLGWFFLLYPSYTKA